MVLRSNMEVVIASNNQHKITEIKAILGGFFSEFRSLKDKGIDIEIDETADTFYGNALIKAKTVSELCGLPAISDDSGLVVAALDGAPGVYSARFAGEPSNDQANNDLLLERLKDKNDRSAKFVSTVVIYFPDGRIVAAEGETQGTIAFERHGDNGFGYDPLFISDDLKKSFAEATLDEKNAVSHRGRALASLRKKLLKIAAI